MEKEFVPTVTITVKEYEGMKSEIYGLKQQVQEKTITKVVYTSKIQDILDRMPVIALFIFFLFLIGLIFSSGIFY